MGHWASIDWFALSERAGVDNTRLYAESMAEWTRKDGAVDNAPGRVRYYWMVSRVVSAARAFGAGSGV